MPPSQIGKRRTASAWRPQAESFNRRNPRASSPGLKKDAQITALQQKAAAGDKAALETLRALRGGRAESPFKGLHAAGGSTKDEMGNVTRQPDSIVIYNEQTGQVQQVETETARLLRSLTSQPMRKPSARHRRTRGKNLSDEELKKVYSQKYGRHKRMADFFDPFDAPKGGESASFFDPFDAPAPAKETKKQNKGIHADIGTDLKRGVERLPVSQLVLQTFPLRPLPAKPMPATAANALGDITGFKPSQWGKNTEAEYSPGRQTAKQTVDQAWERIKRRLPMRRAGNFEGLGQIAKSYVQNRSIWWVRSSSLCRQWRSAALPGGARGSGKQARPCRRQGHRRGRRDGWSANGPTDRGGQIRAHGGGSIGSYRHSRRRDRRGRRQGGAEDGVVDPETALAGGAIRRPARQNSKTVAQSLRSAAGRVAGGAVSEGAFEELPAVGA